MFLSKRLWLLWKLKSSSFVRAKLRMNKAIFIQYGERVLVSSKWLYQLLKNVFLNPVKQKTKCQLWFPIGTGHIQNIFQDRVLRRSQSNTPIERPSRPVQFSTLWKHYRKLCRMTSQLWTWHIIGIHGAYQKMIFIQTHYCKGWTDPIVIRRKLLNVKDSIGPWNPYQSSKRFRTYHQVLI